MVAGGLLAGAVGFLAVARTAVHVPTSLTPWPVAYPGVVSFTNVYNGSPLKVTCTVPSALVTVPSEPTVPLGEAPVDVASGCHTFRHAPLQMNFPAASPVKR